MKNAEYYNKNKWIMSSRFPGHPLKAKPLEIREDLYVHLNDTTLNASSRLNDYTIYRFNTEGDLNYTKTVYTDSFWTEGQGDYVKNGYQMMNVYHSGSMNYTTRRFSIYLGNGRFKEIVDPFHSNSLMPEPRVTIESFTEGGNIVKQEFFNDTINMNAPYQTLIIFYEGQRILRQVGIRKKDTTDRYQYYYSKELLLDSIRYIVERKYAKKEIFVNNEHGDVVKFFEITSGGDTISTRVMQYEYDKYGNWIKQIEKSVEKNNYTNAPNNNPYSLVVRNIKYSDK